MREFPTDIRYFIVCGSRAGIVGGAHEVETALDMAFPAVQRHFIHIISGSFFPEHCVDRRAFDWAMKREVMGSIIPAWWETGSGSRPAEGPFRNRRMLRLPLQPITALLAFQGGNGTADMIRAAETAKVPVWRWLSSPASDVPGRWWSGT